METFWLVPPGDAAELDSIEDIFQQQEVKNAPTNADTTKYVDYREYFRLKE